MLYGPEALPSALRSARGGPGGASIAGRLGRAGLMPGDPYSGARALGNDGRNARSPNWIYDLPSTTNTEGPMLNPVRGLPQGPYLGPWYESDSGGEVVGAGPGGSASEGAAVADCVGPGGGWFASTGCDALSVGSAAGMQVLFDTDPVSDLPYFTSMSGTIVVPPPPLQPNFPPKVIIFLGLRHV